MIVIDCSIPKPVAESLKQARAEDEDPIFWLAEIMPAAPSYGAPQNAKDPDWIGKARREGWIVITRDEHLRTRPLERRLMIDNKVACSCVHTKANPTILEYVYLIAAVLPEIEALALTEERPYFYGIYKPGRLERWMMTHPFTGVRY